MTIKFYDSPFHVTHPDSVASIMAINVDLSNQVTRKGLINIVCRDIRRGDIVNAEKLLKVYNAYWRNN